MSDTTRRPSVESAVPAAPDPRTAPAGPPQPVDTPPPYRYRERRVLAGALAAGGLTGAALAGFDQTLLAMWLSLAVALSGLGLLRHWRWARALGRAVFTWMMIVSIYWLLVDPFEYDVLALALLGIVGAWELWRWPLPQPEQERVATRAAGGE